MNELEFSINNGNYESLISGSKINLRKTEIKSASRQTEVKLQNTVKTKNPGS